jgi:hypothetical protein
MPLHLSKPAALLNERAANLGGLSRRGEAFLNAPACLSWRGVLGAHSQVRMFTVFMRPIGGSARARCRDFRGEELFFVNARSQQSVAVSVSYGLASEGLFDEEATTLDNTVT